MAAACGRALRYFDAGNNCAESVMRAFLDREDVPFSAETAMLATGFGGGMGATHHTCGAVTGCVMALGALYGRPDPAAFSNREEGHEAMRREIYPIFAGFVCEAERELGTLECSELTASLEGPARRARCREYVGICAALCEKHAEQNKK